MKLFKAIAIVYLSIGAMISSMMVGLSASAWQGIQDLPLTIWNWLVFTVGWLPLIILANIH